MKRTTLIEHITLLLNVYRNLQGGNVMPIVTVQLLEGRTDEQKRALVEKVTEAVAETTGAPAQNVTIIIEDMSKAHYATGGVRACDK